MRFENLYVQESDEEDYLLIKPVPGQVIAQVDPGPHQVRYAELFASAPDLLRALKALTLCLSDNNEDYPDNAMYRMVSDRVAAAERVLEPFKDQPTIVDYEGYTKTVSLAKGLGWDENSNDDKWTDDEGYLDADKFLDAAESFLKSRGVEVD